MVVFVIYVYSVLFNKGKRNSPIAADLYRPGAFPITPQLVQLQT